MAESPPSAVPALPGLAIEAVEWLPSGADSGLVRVRGRWTEQSAREPDLPALIVRAAGSEQRFESLPDARFSRDADSWRGTYLVPAALVASDPEALWLEWPSGVRAGLPALARGVEPPPVPVAPEPPDEPGGQVIDRAVLAERRARRAELAEQSQARVAAEALKAVEVLELRSVELERRLVDATAERDALAARTTEKAVGREALAAALASAAALRSRSREWQLRLRASEVAHSSAAVRVAVLEAERATGTAALRSTLHAHKQQLAELRDEAERRATELAAATEVAAAARAELTREREVAEAQLTAARESAATTAAELARARDEAASHLARLEDLRRRAADERAIHEKVRTELERALAEARAGGEEARGRLGALESGLASAEGRLQTAETALATAEARLRVETVARTALEDHLDRERTAHEADRGALAELKVALAAARAELGSSRAQRDAAKAAAEDLRRDRDAARSEAESSRAAAKAARAELERLQVHAERTGASLQARITELERSAAETAADLQRRAREQAEAASAAERAPAAETGQMVADLDAAAEALRSRTPPPPMQPLWAEALARSTERAPAPPAPTESPPATESPPVAASPATESPPVAEPPIAVEPSSAAATSAVAPPPRQAPRIVSASRPPSRGLVVGSSRRDYPLLRGAIVKLAHDDPGAAGRLLAALLPAQGAVVAGAVSYDLTINGIGTFGVTVGDGRATVERLARPRPRGQADFHLRGEPLALAELLAGIEHRIGRFFGAVRVRGKRRRLAALEPLPAGALSLADAARACAQLEPELVYRAFAYAIHPSWTRGHSFTIAQAITSDPPETWYLTARDGAGLAVAESPPSGVPDATVAMTRGAFDRLLRGDPPASDERPSVRGDREAVEVMRGWTLRTQTG